MPTPRRSRAGLLAAILVLSSLAGATAAAPPAAADLATAAPDDICVTGFGVIGEVNDTVFDAAGNLWWTEGGAVSPPAIGRRRPDGRVDRFADGLLVDRDILRGITLGPDGNVWFTSANDIVAGVGRITPTGVITMFRTGIGAGKVPVAITAGADGNVWFTEAGGDTPTIGRITPAGDVTELPFPAAAPSPFGITLGPDGNVWFTARESIGRITPAGEVTMFTEGLQDQVDPGDPARNGSPVSLTFGSDGNLWFARGGGNTDRVLGRMTPTGAVTDFALAPAEITGAERPGGALLDVTLGPDGNVWFTDLFGGRIGRVTPTGDVTVFTEGVRNTKLGVEVTKGPTGITPGPDGALWYGEIYDYEGQDPGGIARISLDGEVESFGSLPFGEPILGLTTAPDGTIWFTNRFGVGRRTVDGRLEMVNSDGFFSNLVSTYPVGITTDGDGNVWFAELDADRIGRLTPAGVLTRFSAGITPGSAPRNIVVGPDGNVWFTEDAGRVGRVTPAGVITEFSAGIAPGSTVQDITAGADGNLWFTITGGDPTIGRITPTGEITQFVISHDGAGEPVLDSITAGPDGNVWFTHRYGAIGRITPSGEMTFFFEGLQTTPFARAIPRDIVSAGGALWFTLPSSGQFGRITVDGRVSLVLSSNPPNLGQLSFEPFPGFPMVRANQIVAGPADSVWWSVEAAVGPARLVQVNERDAIGEPCTPDEDGDGFADGRDAFPFDPAEWLDTDHDTIGNNADPDDDGDGLPDARDPKPLDPDADDDGRIDGADNCVLVANPDQVDGDRDGIGDRCDRSVTITVNANGLTLVSRLLDAAGAPIRGASITFSARSGARLCVAGTDANGRATCTTLLNLLALVPLGYQATFAGDAAHDPGVARSWTNPPAPPPPPALPPIKIVIRL